MAAIELTRPTEGVALLTMRRPDQLNAISSGVADELSSLVDDVSADDAVRAMVIAGEGRAFCAGADISELEQLAGPADFSRFVQRLTDAFDVLAACPKPSVAALHGAALGGGLELALACDLRVAESGTRLGVPEIKLGVLPGAGGTARLPRLLPTAVAKQLLLTGEPLSAEDALRLGLVNEVCASGEAVRVALDLAGRLAGLAPLALAAAKELVAAGPSLSLDAAIELERQTVSMLFGTRDREEGLRAFREKRAPVFEGG
jgi:enoyl-CoA hydratase/carnithine racemase